MNMYAKLLRELEEGNAVLLDIVNGRKGGAVDRFRLVTPNDCEYSYQAFIEAVRYTESFVRSCFVGWDPNPINIVYNMENYDDSHGLKIRAMRVL